MEKYIFKAANWVIFVLLLILSFVLGVFIVIFAANYNVFPKDNPTTILVIFFIVFLVFSFYFVRKSSFAKVEITFFDRYLSVRWIDSFIFYKNKDIIIKLTDIKQYAIKSDSNWDWFKVEMKDKNVFRIWHSKFFTNDDFPKFVNKFKLSIQEINQGVNTSKTSSEGKSNEIMIKKSIYQSRFGFVLLIFSVILIIGTPLFLIFSDNINIFNILIFLPGYVGVIYYFITFVRKSKY